MSSEAGRGSRLRAAFERLDHLHNVTYFAARVWSVVICASYSVSYNGGVSVWRVPLPEATGSSGELWPTTPGTAPCGRRTVCFRPRRCSIASFAAASAFSRSASTTTPVSIWLLSSPSKIHQRQIIPRRRGYFRRRYRKLWWGNSMDRVCPAHPTITRRVSFFHRSNDGQKGMGMLCQTRTFASQMTNGRTLRIRKRSGSFWPCLERAGPACH